MLMIGKGRGLNVALLSAAFDADTVARPKTTRKATTEPPYKVLLHNDHHNSMEHVVIVLRKVIPKMTLQRAISTMWEAHTKGQAVVIKCHKELAESYQEQLKAEGLTATIELD